MGNGWTAERRDRQSKLIQEWKPWEKSTGPRSPEGRQRVRGNAWKGGHREQIRELSKLVNSEIQASRDLMAHYRMT
jgi:hypothetical protein